MSLRDRISKLAQRTTKALVDGALRLDTLTSPHRRPDVPHAETFGRAVAAAKRAAERCGGHRDVLNFDILAMRLESKLRQREREWPPSLEDLDADGRAALIRLAQAEANRAREVAS